MSEICTYLKKEKQKQKQYFCTLWTCNFSMFLCPSFPLLMWNDPFCSYTDDVSTWWQIFNHFLLGVDYLIFYASRYFFFIVPALRDFFKAVLDIFVLLKSSARYFFFNQKHMLDIFGGISTTPFIQKQMVNPYL